MGSEEEGALLMLRGSVFKERCRMKLQQWPELCSWQGFWSNFEFFGTVFHQN